MINKEIFFSNCIKAIKSSDISYQNAMDMLKVLLLFDPYNLTTFEFILKVKKRGIGKEVQFLNLDAKGYSYHNTRFFLKRILLFEKILERKCKNKKAKKITEALRNISKNAMDIYFGAGIEDSRYVFAFWLVFGGVKRSGSVSFWPYDFDNIMGTLLHTAGMEKNKLLNKEILNFGFEIGSDYLHYNLCYLCREKVMPSSVFGGLMENLNSRLSDFKYFYFFNETYDENGEIVKERLFIEFLEDVKNQDEGVIRALLDNILRLDGIEFDLENVVSAINKCEGRTSLISFEKDGTLNFYIQPV